MGGGNESSNSKFDEIMVRFRPIAPKPAVGGSAEVLYPTKRKKRRYVKKKRVVSEAEEISVVADPPVEIGEEDVEVVTTLCLLPETNPVTSSHLDLTQIHESNPMVQMQQQQQQEQQESVVIMECVESIGSEEMMNIDLERDTCPGFISDGYDNVWWTNPAYRRLVGSERVRIVMNDRFPVTWGLAFVCRVRLQYSLIEEKKSMILPCDVWKINGSHFAWRLDVQAALSLGR